MIQANELSVAFAGRKILEDVSFNVHKGEKIGLVGRNGSGKTTLFKIITGDIEPDSGTLTVPKNYTVGCLQQHLLFTEETILQEVCKGLKAGEEDDVWKGEKMLMGLGFSVEEMSKPPSFFSGGYQVRLNLAKVLLSEPHLLLLDEPTNYLDIVSIRWLINFLRSGENELILITHDRDFMDSIITHTMGIHRGRLKKTAGKTGRYFERINADEELYEKTRIKDEKKQKEAEEFINRFRAQASRASLVQSRLKMLDKMEKKTELETVETLGFSFKYSDFKAKELMKAENVSFGYEPGKKLFDGFSINIARNDRICVVGKNGKGKSTLLRIFARELEPDEGTIKRHDNIKTGYFGQTNIERLNKKNTIEEELSEVRPDLAYSEVRKVCGAMMFSGDLALKEISVLSGGEKSRVSLGKILLNPSNLLLLDEPTNHLDMESCDSMARALDDFPGAVIMVTHSELFLKHMANRL
ncbi:MAG: ABC-F family ATP-binding cassette domain-containing protein, partial [bacterium]